MNKPIWMESGYRLAPLSNVVTYNNRLTLAINTHIAQDISHQIPPCTAQEEHSLTRRTTALLKRPCPILLFSQGISKWVPSHVKPTMFSAEFMRVLIEKKTQTNHMVKASVHSEQSQAFFSLITLLKASKQSANTSYQPWDLRARLNELTVSFYF